MNNIKANELYLNHIGCFSLTLMDRRESIQDTISLLKIEDEFGSNLGFFDRTAHLYRTSRDSLAALKESLDRNNEFTDVDIIHKSSCLGLPYQIYAKHKTGKDVFFDGLAYLVAEPIHIESFCLNEIQSIASYPHRVSNIIQDLEFSLREVLSDLPEMQYSMYSFYTANVDDWKSFGFTRVGDAQLHLLINDPRFITQTGLIHTKIGKEYSLYIGDRDVILEMNSHHMFYISEFDRYSNYINHIREKIETASCSISTAMNDITKSFPKFLDKYASWNASKSSIRKMYEIKKVIKKYYLLSALVQDLANKRYASRNSPKQIWFNQSEIDNEWKQSYWCTNFFQAKLEGHGVSKIEEEPMKPLFNGSIEQLVYKIGLLNEELQEIMSEIRDLLSAIQTEFSMYAVWLAFGAVIVSILVTLLSVAAG